jgi:hypothetical protein
MGLIWHTLCLSRIGGLMIKKITDRIYLGAAAATGIALVLGMAVFLGCQTMFNPRR